MDGLDREALELELTRLQEWFHLADDWGGTTFQPSKTTLDRNRTRFVDLLVALGCDPAPAAATLDALTQRQSKFPVKTYPIDAEGRLMDFIPTEVYQSRAPLSRELEGWMDKYIPVQLRDHGPEAEAERLLLLSVLSDPSLTPHTRHKEDGLDDLKQNFLYGLYQRQDDVLVGKIIDRPVHPYHAFCQWFFGRAVAYGYARIDHFDVLVAEAYPHQTAPDKTGMSRALYVDRPPLLQERDPSWFDWRVRHADPNVLPLIGSLMESYMDLVNAVRPQSGQEDLPQMHKPDAKRNGFARYKARMATVYQRLHSAVSVATAFGSDPRPTTNYLKRVGVMQAGEQQRHRRRY